MYDMLSTIMNMRCQNDTPSSSLVPKSCEHETPFSFTSELSEHKCENETSLSSASPIQDEHIKHENRSESSIGFGSIKHICAPCWHVDPERDLDQSIVAKRRTKFPSTMTMATRWVNCTISLGTKKNHNIKFLQNIMYAWNHTLGN